MELKTRTTRSDIKICTWLATAAVCAGVFLAGCAQAPIYSALVPASSRVEVAPAGKVIVNIHRPDEFFSAQRTFLVFDRSKFIGSLGVGTSIQYIADPGEHLIIACACAGAQAAPVQVPSAVSVTLLPGQSFDLLAEFATGWDVGQAALGDRVKFAAAASDVAKSLRQSAKLVRPAVAEVDNAAARRVVERALKIPSGEIARLGSAAASTEPAKADQSPVKPSQPVRAEPLPATQGRPADEFDQCFDRCRKLTDRSKEQCFDTCRK